MARPGESTHSLRRHRLAAVLVSTTLCGAVACSTDDRATPPPGPDLTACAVEPDIPLVYLDRRGKPTGFAFLLLGQIVERRRGTLRLDRVSATAVTFRLLDGRCDVIVSSLTDDPAELESVAASSPYLDADLGLGVRGTDTQTFPTVASLAGRTIGCAGGTPGEAWLRANLPPGATLLAFPTHGDAFAALRQKRVDGVVATRAAVAHRAQADSAIGVTEVIGTARSFVFGVRSRDRATLRLIDDGLDALRADGSYAELRQRWFGDQIDG